MGWRIRHRDASGRPTGGREAGPFICATRPFSIQLLHLLVVLLAIKLREQAVHLHGLAELGRGQLLLVVIRPKDLVDDVLAIATSTDDRACEHAAKQAWAGS